MILLAGFSRFFSLIPIVAAPAWLFSSVACAGQWNLLMSDRGGAVVENGRSSTRIENKVGGIQYDFGGARQPWITFVVASGFVDTNLDSAYYAGGGLAKRILVTENRDNFHLDAGLLGGVMHRPDYNDGEPFLKAIPILSVGTHAVSLNIAYIPKVGSEISDFWLFQFKLAKRSFW